MSLSPDRVAGQQENVDPVDLEKFVQNVIFSSDRVAGFQSTSLRPRHPETDDSVDFEKFDQNVISSFDGVAGYEFTSPRPGQPETVDSVDI